jgi:NAD(P)-dependent dehydrogenase (short-subunit alcohol dehydrogenase family)
MSASNGRLQGKVAIVTGAGQGGGYGAAIAMARAGAAIALVGRTRSKLSKVADEIAAIGGRSLVIPADVSSREAITSVVAKTAEHFGRIDILVSAAQSPEMRAAPIAEISDEDVEDLWRSGAVATLAFMRAVRPHMIAAGGGSIINFGSATIHRPAQYGVYAGVKAAIQAISRAAAMEWAGEKIRVNTVLPFVSSPAADADFAMAEGRREAIIRNIPLGRIGDPELDIGRPVVFLASDESGFITGSTFSLDGGGSYLR